MTMFNSCAFGTEAAAVAVNSPSPTTGVILYDGSTWTVGTSIPTVFKQGAASGVDTAGIVFGNDVGPFSTDTFEYASGTWTSGGALNSGRARGSSSKNAPQTSTLYFGGNNPGGTEKNETESYDGTTWSTSPTIATAVRGNTGGGASNASAVSTGGYDGSSYITTSQEFNRSSTVITAGAWASGGALPGNRGNQGGSIGDSTTQLGVSGQVTYPLFTNATDEYASSTWTAGGIYPTTIRWAQGGGTVTAAWMSTGETSVPNGPTLNTTNTYNGTSWTAGNVYPTVLVQGVGGCGSQTAGLGWGGNLTWGTTPQQVSNEYNGTWTAGGSLPGHLQSNGACGTQTAALSIGGGPPEKTVLSYNGTAWSAEPSTIRAISGASAAGTTTSALLFAFDSPPAPSGTYAGSEGYDGTSWYSQPNMGTSRGGGLSRSGTSTAAIGAGGYTDPARIDNTEEFTGATTSLNYETITSS